MNQERDTNTDTIVIGVTETRYLRPKGHLKGRDAQTEPLTFRTMIFTDSLFGICAIYLSEHDICAQY